MVNDPVTNLIEKPKETRQAKFVRMVNKRMEKMLDQHRLLGQLSGNSYKHTPEQVTAIFTTLRESLDEVEKRFVKPEPKQFSLTVVEE